MDTAWDFLAFPRLCGLLAKSPTRLSQEMHNAGFKALSLPFCYVAFDTEDTKAAFVAMRKLGIRSYSLTIPHKEAALPFLDQLDPTAKKIAAVNTVVNDGKVLHGFNTDHLGIEHALKEVQFEAKGKTVLLYGAGGASRAAVVCLERLGAKRILIANRNTERAVALAKEFGLETLAEESLKSLEPASIDLIVNSTPIGSKLEQRESPLLAFYSGKQAPALFEMVTRETPLEAAAKRARATVISGSRMLLFQALEQFRLFTTQEPPRQAMENALAAALAQSNNSNPASSKTNKI